MQTLTSMENKYFQVKKPSAATMIVANLWFNAGGRK